MASHKGGYESSDDDDPKDIERQRTAGAYQGVIDGEGNHVFAARLPVLRESVPGLRLVENLFDVIL